MIIGSIPREEDLAEAAESADAGKLMADALIAKGSKTLCEQADNIARAFIEHIHTLQGQHNALLAALTIGLRMARDIERGLKTEPLTLSEKAELLEALMSDRPPGEYGYRVTDVSIISPSGAVTCPSCTSAFKIPRKELSALAGAYLSSRRKVRAGNTKKLTPCKYCGEQMGVNDLRSHEPSCVKKPASVKRGRPPAKKAAESGSASRR